MSERENSEIEKENWTASTTSFVEEVSRESRSNFVTLARSTA